MFLPHQEILIWTIIIIFIVTLMYRFMVDPKKMRQIKKDMKFYSEKSKEARKKKDTKKTSEYADEMMKLSRKQFGLNTKPMMVSLLVFFLALYTVLGAYGTTIPIVGTYVGGILVNTDEVVNQDTHTGVLKYKDLSYPLQVRNESHEDERTAFKIAIDHDQNNGFSDDEMYSPGDIVKIGNLRWKIHHSDMDKTFFILSLGLPFTPPPLPVLGNTGNQVDWIWWYVLCAITLSFTIRKLLGVE
ncbi:MAG: EMC3/TMCO1 family protein [Candidatus Aenigmarchaeota archaeon]